MPPAVASTERHTFNYLAARGARETLVFVSMLATAAVCVQAAVAQSVFDDAEPERFQHDLMLSTVIVLTPF